MKTTIHNIETEHGCIRVKLFSEGDNQAAHIFKNELLVAMIKFEKVQESNLTLLDLIRRDFSCESSP